MKEEGTAYYHEGDYLNEHKKSIPDLTLANEPEIDELLADEKLIET